MIVLKASFRKSFSSLALAALLVLPVMGVAPAIAAAQPVSTRAAASLAFFDQPPVPSESDKGKETKAEESQEAKFRHSATIEWFSKLFGIDIDTTADIFEYINFAVILLAVGIPLFRGLPKLFRKRQAKLSADIEVAQAKTADANDRLGIVEAKLKGLDAEIDAIRKQVDEAMRADEARAKASIEEETARILASAEHEIAQAGAQAQRGLRQFAADLAVDRALTKINLDADTDRALIAEFASDIATGHRRARKGEQN
ncbi:MAG TPA: ATP synthase F0 subunit B [Acidobacteriaceae bacterium]|nr:ATP synthase F0 subunit B [Acidobacteriaceae bacterium]